MRGTSPLTRRCLNVAQKPEPIGLLGLRATLNREEVLRGRSAGQEKRRSDGSEGAAAAKRARPAESSRGPAAGRREAAGDEVLLSA